ncbi:HNH endonuclease [Allobaculum mucilyticum]
MEQVHHIVPLSQGGTHDENNLMSLCKSCHSRIHANVIKLRFLRPHQR